MSIDGTLNAASLAIGTTAQLAVPAPIIAEPVRVLFLYDHLGYPNGVTHGLTRYCLGVLPRLNTAPIELSAAFLREPHPAGDALSRAGLEPLFLSRSKWDPRALGDVISLIRSRRIEIVHAAGQKGILAGCAAARLTGCGTIVHLRDVYPLNPALRALMRTTVRSADLALGVSEAVCRHAASEYGIPPERTKLLYNGIALDELVAPEPARVSEWRTRHGIKPSERAIGIIGRLSPVKGHARMLAQMPRVLQRVPEAVLVLVGDGPMRGELEEIARSLDLGASVRFVGQQHEIATVLGGMDVVAIPSDHEGLCHAGLEALAIGRPVVARAVGGLPEALGRGAHGILVPPGDDDAFGDALVRVLTEPGLAATLNHGVARHLEQFRIELHVERQREIYLLLARELRTGRRARGRSG